MGGSRSGFAAFVSTLLTVLLAVLGIWGALIAVTTVIEEILGSFVDLEERWTAVINPAVWFGWHTGFGLTLDDWLGTPSGAGGTVNPWLVAGAGAALAFICWLLIGALWKVNSAYDDRRV